MPPSSFIRPILAASVVALCTLPACWPARAAEASSTQAPTPAPSKASRFPKAPPGKRLAVLYTGSVQGYVEPCGCTGDPLGGVARQAAMVAEARAAYGDRVVVVDAGDLLFEKPTDTKPADVCQADARVKLLLDSAKRAGVVATVLGPLDDVRGAAWRDQRVKGAGLVTVGVPDAGRALVEGAAFSRSVVKDAGGVRVAITGFRADDEARAAVVAPALAAEVEAQRKASVDVIVVLAQAPRALTRRIVKDVKGIDVIVLGRAPGEVPVAPERIGDALLVASGQQAQQLGVLELVLDGRAPGQVLALDDRAARAAREGKLLDARIEELTRQTKEDSPRRAFLLERLAAAKTERAALDPGAAPLAEPHVVARAIPLARGLPEEPTAARALASYTARIPALVTSCEAEVTCPSAPPGSPVYVGAETCRACHAPAYAFWQQQGVDLPGKDAKGKAIVRRASHAHAWDTLVDAQKDRDRSCVGCHSIGFEQQGGYCRTSDVGFRKGVQCESCHGPGSIHATTLQKRDIVAVPKEAACRACHQVPHIQTTESFVFSDKRKLILGVGHGEGR